MHQYFKPILAVILSAVMASAVSCSDKKKDTSSSSSTKESSSSVSSSENSEKTTTVSTASSENGTTVTTEPVTVTVSENGYPSAQEAAQNYYNAYLTNNYEAMDERLSQSEFNESSEIPLVALYFHEPFNVNQKFKSLPTDFTKFTKITFHLI